MARQPTIILEPVSRYPSCGTGVAGTRRGIVTHAVVCMPRAGTSNNPSLHPTSNPQLSTPRCFARLELQLARVSSRCAAASMRWVPRGFRVFLVSVAASVSSRGRDLVSIVEGCLSGQSSKPRKKNKNASTG